METPAQKALRAVDQYPHLKTDREKAEAVEIGSSSVQLMKAALNRDHTVRARIVSGELATMAEVGRAAKVPSVVNRKDYQLGGASTFGKGDKFNEAIHPIRRYLNGWEGREYRFSHVAPAEARRRLAVIDGLVEQLGHARADLAQRSRTAGLSFDPDKKRR